VSPILSSHSSLADEVCDRPNLWINETLMASTAFPRPPTSPSPLSAVHSKLQSASIPSIIDPNGFELVTTPTIDDDGKLKTLARESEVSPWGAILSSASDHSDDHLPKVSPILSLRGSKTDEGWQVIRALAFAATHFGNSPAGFYHSSLPGTSTLDGSIVARGSSPSLSPPSHSPPPPSAAGISFRTLGWEYEGQPCGSWDRSVLGFPSSWSSSPLSHSLKGKSPLPPSQPPVVPMGEVVIRHKKVERESEEVERERREREEEEEEERGLMA
jgi:hypothetical protein